jgi:putative flippase GtrA
MDTLWDGLYALYERAPAGARRRLSAFISSPLTLRWFVLYAGIGVSGVTVYFGLLWIFLRQHMAALPATMISYLLGASLQFVLNRYVNFQAFDRSVARQASSYLAIIVLNLMVTAVVVMVGVHAFHLHAFTANLATIPFTFPTAYLANRYMTFGPGIRARVREWARARSGSV